MTPQDKFRDMRLSSFVPSASSVFRLCQVISHDKRKEKKSRAAIIKINTVMVMLCNKISQFMSVASIFLDHQYKDENFHLDLKFLKDFEPKARLCRS